jgi:hypothetical protein
MVSNKSLDELKVIAALLHDVQNAHGSVFNTRACRNTINIVLKRTRSEGMGFLTKTLPRLAKAFDKAIAGDTPLNATSLGFSTQAGSELPRFLGEFFNRVLQTDGALLQNPCAYSVGVIRDVCYLFYKYELPYTEEQEQSVISKFERTEADISACSTKLQEIATCLEATTSVRARRPKASSTAEVAREAKKLLWELFRYFDPTDINPRHGPGVVATKQQLSGKYLWTNVSDRITSKYPLDAYYYASLSHVCDRLDSLMAITGDSLPAKVILVPKDSRGPRLISCEPVDFQWIQQGLGRAIVEHVERHPLTKESVRFTDQTPNRYGALLGSITGRYATLDLNEASDRVSVGLVRLLFPEPLLGYLEACRSSSTVLPDGRELELQKYAPMGSCLCFPVLALTIWAILAAGAPNADTRESIYVYGDDVIVPTAYAVNAMELLESFGLKVNRDKSCISGLFRESCGMDAFKGVNVTPVRLRTVWSSTRSPESYTSWIAYANSFYDKKQFLTYDYIVSCLLDLYGPIPDEEISHKRYPSLKELPACSRRCKRRWNKSLQRLEYHVYVVTSPQVTQVIDGWAMLLRYFVEKAGPASRLLESQCKTGPGGINHLDTEQSVLDWPVPFSVSTYTKRRSSILVRRWR